MESCFYCGCELIEGELILCDRDHMSAVIAKLFYEIIEEGF